ncbi:MAG: trigger factor [Proteiniphilum sp.]|jgi:trigger factor|nr:trigger factor [Proteiniphilum sp.]
MKSTLNKTNDVNGTIVIEVEKADYQEKVDKSLNQYSQKANIPGFRQGKVPRNLIRKLYGKAVMVSEINKMLVDEMENFIRDNKLKVFGEPLPADNPDEELDLDNDKKLSFTFDVALVPEFDLALDKSVVLTCYTILPEPELVDRQMDIYRQNFGTYTAVEDEIRDTDLIKGTLVEMEGDSEKDNGQVIENAVLMPSHIKDEETGKHFVGVKSGDSVIFNPQKACGGHEAELASLLQTTREDAAKTDSDFRFDIAEVTRYEKATMNSYLFDRVLGEGMATTEEEFTAKVVAELSRQFKPDADYFFLLQARDHIVKMLDGVTFPDELLKRSLLKGDDKYTPEEIETNFPKIMEELKFRVARQKIFEEHGITVESADVEALAAEMAKIQLTRFGIVNPPDNTVQTYAKGMFENEKTVRELYERTVENKFTDWLKETVTVIRQEIPSKDFNKLAHSYTQQFGEYAAETTPEPEEKAETK